MRRPVQLSAMTIRAALLITAVVLAAPLSAKSDKPADNALHAAVASPQRSAAFVARDVYRHPEQTLAFFGIRPTMTVVEIWPSAGYYSEILAPMLRERGHYIAAVQANPKYRDTTLKLFASDPSRYDRVTVVTFDPKQPADLAPAGTVDALITFRNVHNLVMAGDDQAAQAFTLYFRALKPGGTLGVEDHRLPEAGDAAREKTSGYLKPSTVIRLAEAAGFRFVAASEVNANPKDNADHPKGVWTLPPTLILGDQDRDRYLAIGESDRMTLKFVKPKR
jgi:predicted methyltransferase